MEEILNAHSETVLSRLRDRLHAGFRPILKQYARELHVQEKDQHTTRLKDTLGMWPLPEKPNALTSQCGHRVVGKLLAAPLHPN